MDYFSAKINELVTSIPGAKKSIVRAFIARPPETTLLSKGLLFGLFELDVANRRLADLLDVIIEEIQDNYYSVAAIGGDTDLEAAFEAALQKTNIAIAAFLEHAQIAVNLERINAVICLQFHKQLYLTSIGNLGLYLFQRLTKGGYRIVNILEISKTPLVAPHPLKLFSQVISGGIGSRDVVALITSSLLDYFSLERLKNILTGTDGIAALERSIGEFKTECNFGLVQLQIEKRSHLLPEEVAAETFDYQVAASHDSMRELDRTERETAKLLTPSVFPEIKKYAGLAQKMFTSILGTLKIRSMKTANRLAPAARTARLKLTESVKSVRTAAKLPPPSPSLRVQFRSGRIQELAETMAKKMQRVPLPRSINGLVTTVRRQLSKIPVKLPARLAGLPASSKFFLLITIVLVVLFSTSVIWSGVSSRRTQAIESFNQLILDAETKKNEAEASLIYRDENQARQLLASVSSSLSASNPPTKAQRDQVELLLRQIEEKLQSLRHLIEITDPILLANFQNIDGQADIAPVIAASGSTLYTQNRNNQAIYKVNTQTRIINSTYSSDGGTGKFALGTTLGTDLFFLDEERQAYLLTPGADKIVKKSLALNNSAATADVTSFKGRLYFLDTVANQIYRYQPQANGYVNNGAWVRDSGANFSDASSLAVDGAAYVLHRSGSIEKFENGSLVDFEPVVIDPPLKSPTKIRTTPESKYLYILDPPTKRLIVLDKAGHLINQYTAQQFTEPKDFVIAEAEKKMYLLAGTSVFGIRAIHLE